MKEEQRILQLLREIQADLGSTKAKLKQAEQALEEIVRHPGQVRVAGRPEYGLAPIPSCGEIARQALSSIRQTRGGSGAQGRPSRGLGEPSATPSEDGQ